MPNLHAHYYHGNVKAFRHELDGTAAAGAAAALNGASGANGANGNTGSSLNPGSASGGRSWQGGFVHAAPAKADPNERDALGRTVLHIAAATPTQQAYNFFAVLLRNPNLSVNLQDYESGYTALHRALYAGNIRAARDLLARSDTDISIKDSEGLTPFDLYNGTVEGTNPPSGASEGTDLYTWGVNRNYALGIGDSSDKAFPDRVHLLTQKQASDRPDPAERFFNVGVQDVEMSKLHTGVLTTESRGNLSLCGFGNGGRLGRAVHSQLSLTPLPDFPHQVTALALGQDHSLALTSGGYILAWGNNRFAQLGYPMDAPDRPNPFAKEGDELIQTTPKRIIGPLKKEFVRGVAAGRMSSACWTADALWTWGTNLGHLGYEKAGTPIQVNPRKVTAISETVIDVALSDYAMICILDNHEVLCFHHDTHFKISFGGPQRSLKAPKNPGQVNLDPNIVKVTSRGQMFATLSKAGDVCTFQLPHPSEEATKDIRDRHVTVKPQIMWALRKNFTAVKDMALGGDGTIIICTHSGHVFVRQRGKTGSAKYKRIPYLQRIIKVAANDSGAFAAVRIDARPTAITLKGKTLEEDLFLLQPHIRRFESQMNAEDFDRQIKAAALGQQIDPDDEESAVDSAAHDTFVAVALCQILSRWQATNAESLFAWSESLLGSDVSVVVGEISIPAHSVILSLRSDVFRKLLNGSETAEKIAVHREGDAYTVNMDACHPLVALLLLQYVYSDDMAAVWDSRVAYVLQTKFKDLALPLTQVKADIKHFAEVLELAPLLPVLALQSKSTISTKTLANDLASFFTKTSTPPSKACDIVIVLADREVACQSVLLRARCPFFEAFFADRDWTLNRREDGKVVVDMDHLRWRPMALVFKFIHEGVEDDLFDYLHQETLDEFLDFVFEVLAAATELLMDRLVLVCSRVIAKHCNPYNAAALATEASFYQATTLKNALFDYISSCLETMLESGLLDDMEDDVLRDLSTVIARKQSDKSVLPRSGLLVDEVMAKHRDWLALQDIPTPRVRVPTKWKPRSPLLQPHDRRASGMSPLSTPDLKPLQPANAVEEMFSMDEDHSPSTQAVGGSDTPRTRPMTPLSLSAGQGPGSSKTLVWKSRTVESEKVDLRSIMAEAAATKTPRASTPSTPARPGARNVPGSSPVLGPSTPRSIVPPLSSGGTPWRTVDQRKTSLSAVQSQQQSSSPLSASPLASARASGSQASPAPGSQRAGLITPMKQAMPSGSVRRAGTGAAWTTPTYSSPPPPAPMPSTSPIAASGSSVTQSFSLLAIQQEERDAANRLARGKTIKSFAEIQAEEAEERAAAAEKSREEEFQRWWAEEQSRSQPNGQGAASGSGGAGRGRGRGQKRVPNRGAKGGRASRGGAAGANGDGGEPPAATGSGVEGSPGGGESSRGGGGAGRGRGGGRGKSTRSGRGGAGGERTNGGGDGGISHSEGGGGGEGGGGAGGERRNRRPAKPRGGGGAVKA